MAQKESYAEQLKGKSGLKRIVNAARYSKDGFIAAFKHEAAFRQLIYLHGILLCILCFLSVSIELKMILLMGSALSIVVELFNTGLEAVVDRISDEYHPLSKIAKDVGSAAQCVMLILVGILWFIALYMACA